MPIIKKNSEKSSADYIKRCNLNKKYRKAIQKVAN